MSYWYIVLVLLILVLIGFKRIQFHLSTISQGYLFGLGFVPKSVRIAGVQYIVVSILIGPLEIRWYVWRWGNARS